MRYRKKPVVIEAMQWNTDNIEVIQEFMNFKAIYLGNDNQVGINTLEGLMAANKNDWIIKGVMGEIYPIKDHIFKETYEAVE